MYILQGGVRWYANCGFSHRSSVSFGQERSPKSAPTTCTQPLPSFCPPFFLYPIFISYSYAHHVGSDNVREIPPLLHLRHRQPVSSAKQLVEEPTPFFTVHCAQDLSVPVSSRYPNYSGSSSFCHLRRGVPGAPSSALPAGVLSCHQMTLPARRACPPA